MVFHRGSVVAAGVRVLLLARLIHVVDVAVVVVVRVVRPRFVFFFLIFFVFFFLVLFASFLVLYFLFGESGGNVCLRNFPCYLVNLSLSRP